MTDYSDIPESNRLHEESQRVADAINLLDAGGTLGSFVITPAPAQPGAPPAPMMMPVNISVTEPPTDKLMRDLREWLVAREQQLLEQMQALGVTASPPAHSS